MAKLSFLKLGDQRFDPGQNRLVSFSPTWLVGWCPTALREKSECLVLLSRERVAIVGIKSRTSSPGVAHSTA